MKVTHGILCNGVGKIGNVVADYNKTNHYIRSYNPTNESNTSAQSAQRFKYSNAVQIANLLQVPFIDNFYFKNFRRMSLQNQFLKNYMPSCGSDGFPTIGTNFVNGSLDPPILYGMRYYPSTGLVTSFYSNSIYNNGSTLDKISFFYLSKSSVSLYSYSIKSRNRSGPGATPPCVPGLDHNDILMLVVVSSASLGISSSSVCYDVSL